MKPLYKQGRFWFEIVLGTLALVFLFVIILFANEHENIDKALDKYNLYYDYQTKAIYEKEQKYTKASNDTEPSSSSENFVASVYEIGDEAEFKNHLKVKVNSIDSAPNWELNGNEGKKPYKVSVSITNDGSSSQDFNIHDFSFYDGQNNVANIDASSYSNDIPNQINASQSFNVDIYIGSNNDGPFTVTYGDATWKQ